MYVAFCDRTWILESTLTRDVYRLLRTRRVKELRGLNYQAKIKLCH